MIIWFSICTIVHAMIDADKYKKKIPINHLVESIYYILIAGVPAGLFYFSTLLDPIILCVLCRYALFDVVYNKLRGFDYYYESTTTTSLVDRIERYLNLDIKKARTIGYVLPLLYMLIRIIL